MIISIKDKATQEIWDGVFSRRLPPAIQPVARRKLRMIDAAQEINDLRSPPSNKLEALHGKRKGQWSIRINDQWRICFLWRDGNAEDVEICDYH